MLLLAVDTVVGIVIGIVDVSDIVIDVCFNVGSVVSKIIDIADGLDIAIEVVSGSGLKVDTGVSVVMCKVDVSNIVIDVCFDVGSVVSKVIDVA